MITGANGNLGKRLIQALLQNDEVTAVVRSNKAAQTIQALPLSDSAQQRLDVRVLDPEVG